MMFLAVLCCILVGTFAGFNDNTRFDPLGTEKIIQGNSCDRQQWDTVDGLQPYPEMCHKYYECTRRPGDKFVWKSRRCPEGEQFDKSSKRCDLAYKVQCIDTYGGSCTLEEFGDGVGKLKSVPLQCDKFYQCTVGEDSYYWLEKLCDTGLYFNEATQLCDWPRNVQCRDEQSLVVDY